MWHEPTISITSPTITTSLFYLTEILLHFRPPLYWPPDPIAGSQHQDGSYRLPL